MLYQIDDFVNWVRRSDPAIRDTARRSVDLAQEPRDKDSR
jgi:hypothetical protein